MTQTPKHLAILVGAIAILALALSAVAPALAQGGQTGNQVDLQEGDTLGSLVNQYTLVEDNLRQFLSLNWDLELEEGQTVVYPADITVNFDADAQAFTSVDANGRNTYETQAGDTLGRVLGFTGFVREDAGAAGGDAAATPTTDAGAGTTGGDAGQAGTPAAGDTGAAGQDATPAAGDTGMTGEQAADLTDEQLEAFVDLNQDLTFAADQMVSLPEGVPVTGQETPAAEETPTADDAAQATPTADEAAQATPTAEEGQGGGDSTYTVQAGDTLSSIAAQLGITVEELVDLNPDLVRPGMTLNVPAQEGQIPETGGQDQAQQTPTVEPTPSGDQGGIPQTGDQPQTGEAQNLITVCTGDIPAAPLGAGFFRYRGESLQFLADQTNSTVGDIIALNGPDAFVSGNIIRLPGAEAPGLWNNQLLRNCTTVNPNAQQNQGEE